MWENAAPQSESQKPPPPRPACENGGDTLLWGQMLFCTVVLLVALAARMMGLPFYPELRRTFAQAMQPEQDFFLSTERYFSKFTEKAAAAIAQALPTTSETDASPDANPSLPPTRVRKVTRQTSRCCSRCPAVPVPVPPVTAGAPTPWAVGERTSIWGMTWLLLPARRCWPQQTA